MSYEIHPGDNLVEWNGAVNEASGAYLTAADTVVFSLLADNEAGDAPGTAIAAAADVSMAYKSASNGIFQGVLESAVTATLTVGAYYWIRAVATSGSIVGQRDWRVLFTRRGYRN